MSNYYSGHAVLENVAVMHRYHQWIMDRFISNFGENILEIGSGLGHLSRLVPQKKSLTLSDINRDYVSYLSKHFPHRVVAWDIQKPPPELLAKLTPDTIFSANVLEHIPDDKKAISHFFGVLRPGGKLLLFVPARPEISGPIDSRLGHCRRYTPRVLSFLLKSAGFEIKELRYYNFLGFFAWWLANRLPPFENYYPLTQKIYDALLTPFLYLENHLSVPFGQSLFAVAQKPVLGNTP